MPAAVTTPRLPVGDQTSTGLQAVVRRVVRPDMPLARKVLAVAWPVALTNLLQSLALTVDLIMVGSLGALAIAATGVATQVFYVGMVVAMGLAAGATALVARAIGGGDRDEADRATSVTIALALALSVPLIAFTYFFDAPLLRLLGAEESVVETGGLVLRLLAFGIPGNMLILAASGALAGAGDTRPGLVIGIGVNVVNVALDWILIFGHLGAPAMGLRGAAIATSASFTLGGLAFLWLLQRGRRPVRLRRVGEGARAMAARLLHVGGPTTLEQLILTVGYTAYLVLILHFGAAALAAHGIGLRIQSFAFMPGFGFAAAAAALVGQGLGRGDAKDAERSGWMSIGLGLLVMMALSLPLYALAEPMTRLFTDDPEAVRLGVQWIHTIVYAMPAIAFHFSAAGALRGAGDTRWPLMVSFAGLWLIRLPVAWLLGIHYGMGMTGVWAGYLIEYYARAIVTTWRYQRGAWKTLRV